MMRRALLFLCLFSLLIPVFARAQTAPAADPADSETLPIEVALYYYHLLNQAPPYESLIFANTALMRKTDGFGQSAQISVQRDALKKLYDGFNKDTTLLHAKKNMILTGVVVPQRQLTLDGIAPDLPLIYPLGETEHYGIFIRNAADVASMAAPYEFDDFNALDVDLRTRRVVLPAELTLKPLAADKQDFTLNNGTVVHVLVADIVELKLSDPDGRRLLLQKRFKNWKPGATQMDTLYQPDLAPALLPAAPIAK